MKNFTIRAMSAVAALAMATPVLAAESTSNLAVSALVADTCIVTAVTGLTFATVDTGNVSDESVNGVISVVCTSAKTGVSVDMGGGSNKDGSQRRMSDGGTGFVPYNIHSDSGHVNEVAVDGEIYSGNIAAASPVLINVYGQIPIGNYTQGTYTDSILVTLTY